MFNAVKKAIILYTAVTIIEQLLVKINSKGASDFIIPKDSMNHSAIHPLVKVASQYCK
ncbi:hypothetical protein ACWEWU_13195 [Staphylococcus xylosus]